jgi:hypothetical protein
VPLTKLSCRRFQDNQAWLHLFTRGCGRVLVNRICLVASLAVLGCGGPPASLGRQVADASLQKEPPLPNYPKKGISHNPAVAKSDPPPRKETPPPTDPKKVVSRDPAGTSALVVFFNGLLARFSY